LTLAAVFALGTAGVAEAGASRHEGGGHGREHATRQQRDDHGSLQRRAHRTERRHHDGRGHAYGRGDHYRPFRGHGARHGLRGFHRRHEAQRHHHRRYRHHRPGRWYGQRRLGATSYGIAFDIDGVTFSLRDWQLH